MMIARKTGRKGMSLESAFVVLAIFLISVVVIVMIYNRLYSFGKEKFTDQECQASLRLASVKIAPWCTVESASSVPLRCTRQFITVDGAVDDGSVDIDGKDKTSSYNPSCPSSVTSAQPEKQSCLAENVIAQEMSSCWRTFFEGEVGVLQQVESGDWKFWESGSEKTTLCYVCDEITIKNASGEAIDEHFNAYIRDSRPYSGGVNAGVNQAPYTYYEYFTTPKAFCSDELKKEATARRAKSGLPPVDNCWEAMALEQATGQQTGAATPAQNIPTGDQKYAVVFVRRNAKACSDDDALKDKSSSKLTHTVQFIPAERISEMCNVVIS